MLQSTPARLGVTLDNVETDGELLGVVGLGCQAMPCGAWRSALQPADGGARVMVKLFSHMINAATHRSPTPLGHVWLAGEGCSVWLDRSWDGMVM